MCPARKTLRKVESHNGAWQAFQGRSGERKSNQDWVLKDEEELTAEKDPQKLEMVSCVLCLSQGPAITQPGLRCIMGLCLQTEHLWVAIVTSVPATSPIVYHLMVFFMLS